MRKTKLLCRFQLTCDTSKPLAQTSVEISTLDRPLLKSAMIVLRSSWGISPCIAETVKLLSSIFCVSQSTFFFVLQNITACVMVRVSYKSQRVSNFHSSRSTATKNCLIPYIHTNRLTRFQTNAAAQGKACPRTRAISTYQC